MTKELNFNQSNGPSITESTNSHAAGSYNKGNDKANSDNIDLSQVEAKYHKAVQYINGQYNHGWWPYQVGGSPSTEATAWCSIALRHNQRIAQQVVSYLVSIQNEDGGWTTSPSSGKSDWTSALALLAIRTLIKSQTLDRKTKRCLEKGFAFLFLNRTDRYGAAGRFLLLLLRGLEGLRYSRGWPWSFGCPYWVEPTSYSLICLKSPTVPDREFSGIVEYANTFLLEHVCKGGGWNHGNELCLGIYLSPYTVTTAEALVALQDLKNAKAVKESINYLRKAIHEHPTAMSMAWSVLALHVHGYTPLGEIFELAKLQRNDGSFGRDLMVTGLAATALGILIHDNPLLYG